MRRNGPRCAIGSLAPAGKMLSMRFVLPVALLIAGCSHVQIGASSQTTGVSSTPPRAGNSFSSSSAGLQVNASGGAAALVAGVLIVAALREPAQPGSFRSWSDFSDWFWGRPPPELALDRKVSEQDCSKPLDTSAGNLRCR